MWGWEPDDFCFQDQEVASGAKEAAQSFPALLGELVALDSWALSGSPPTRSRTCRALLAGSRCAVALFTSMA